MEVFTDPSLTRLVVVDVLLSFRFIWIYISDDGISLEFLAAKKIRTKKSNKKRVSELENDRHKLGP